MFDYRVEFLSPWFLTLLALAPLLWVFSYRSLAGLGSVRRAVAILFRTVVLVAIVLALAEIQMVKSSDRVSVIYVLDQSLSIPEEQRQRMIDYVNRSVEEHRRHEDYAGVIVFGREARIEIPPYDDNIQMPDRIESRLDPQYTNLAAALRMAQASFPENAAKRIVIVSDGVENLGNALEQAQSLVNAGIGIDVQPVYYPARGDVAVEKITVPPEIPKGQPFDVNVILNNTGREDSNESGAISGRLIVSQIAGDEPNVIVEQEIDVAPGKQPFSFRQTIDEPGSIVYEARFEPNDPQDDTLSKNNRAETFTHIRGSGQVLIIEDFENPNQHNFLADQLRKNDLEVVVRTSDQLFTNLPELQQFDTIVLANVPREHFSDDQIKMLVRNTHDLGAGLIMLGGQNSFGAGGWTNTELEKAMPVDFQIKAARVMPKGALAMIMHACEMADGNHWQKQVAKAALETLGSQDYCGVLHWNGTETWLWSPGMRRVGGSRERMLAMMERMAPGDMPDFGPTMEMARKGLAALPDAQVKHMIIISDGDPTPPSPAIIAGIKQAKITASTVAIGSHGLNGTPIMQTIANQTGGKYYVVNNPRALPRIFQKEARRVARPLIYEDPNGFSPSITFPNELVSGLEEALPPITGFVLTSVKEHGLVEVPIVSPRPTGGKNNTIMANWQYGLGRSAVFTSDAGALWTQNWAGWDGYGKLFTQMVRWSMRPNVELGEYSVATRVTDGKVQVIVNALDKEHDYLNFLDMAGSVITPEMEVEGLQFEQTAPGRYIGTFDTDASGIYFVNVSPGPDQAPLRLGVNIPYSAEFRNQAANDALLATLAGLEPKGGKPGKVILDPSGAGELETLVAVNPFRRDLAKASSSQDVWHYLILFGSCLFFFDVFIRRVSVSFTWVAPLAGRVRNRLLGRAIEGAKTEYIERLQSRKAEVSKRLEQRRTEARFEPRPGDAVTPDAVKEELSAASSKAKDAAQKRPPDESLTPQEEEESYTSRLLRAKKQVWKDRKEE